MVKFTYTKQGMQTFTRKIVKDLVHVTVGKHKKRAMIVLMRQENSSIRKVVRVLLPTPSGINREVNGTLVLSAAGQHPVGVVDYLLRRH